MRRVGNPPLPHGQSYVEWDEQAPEAGVEVYEEEAKSALVANDSADLAFRWTLNPYRGCYHACAYCYARSYHGHLGWGAGRDFERKLVVKRNIAEVLRRELARPRWQRETVMFSGVTDCYQPLEAHWQLTRACLQACDEFATPVSIISKGVLIRRDAELLAGMAQRSGARVWMSIAFADDATARLLEPTTPPPSKRFAAMRFLADAGVPVGLALSPIVPGINDSDIPTLIEQAAAAGAQRAFMTLLRLPYEVKQVFWQRLDEALPLRVDKVRHALAAMRGPSRMRGDGARWQAIEQLFSLSCKRHGLMGSSEEKNQAEAAVVLPRPAVSPTKPASRGKRQLNLFEET